MPMDLITEVNRLKRFKRDFILSPLRWRQFTTKAQLNWQSVKYKKTQKTQVSTKRGIYAFVVQHPVVAFPANGYIMYIGITGLKEGRTLRIRFGEYFQVSKLRKRPHIEYMLKNWRTAMYFYFAEVTDRRLSLAKLEKEMNDAIIPPYSKNDFSANFRGTRRAAW